MSQFKNRLLKIAEFQGFLFYNLQRKTQQPVSAQK